MKTAYDILNDPFLNKGTAFTKEERDKLSLWGLLPPKIQTIEEQASQTYQYYQMKGTNGAKRAFLMEIFNTNRTLFFYLFSQHLVEFMPIVYDPTIADSIEHYSERFVEPQHAVYLSIDQPDKMQDTLKQATIGRDIQLIVVTDAEGILGIGDWGVNGVDISIGKLMIYTAAAGIDPQTVLPVVLDVGTNRESLLNDSLYLGNRHQRIRGKRYDQFVAKFVETVEDLFPKIYLHWEDFGRANAARILDTYKSKITTFNDDIQGTGIITLAGILGALAISQEKLTDQIYVSYGAGTAGAGITQRVYQEMLQQGLSEQEAHAHFYLVDKQGLLFDDMSDLTPEQRPFARNRSELEHSEQLTNLEAVVKAVKPTILVGTSTVHGAFTETVVKEMAKHTKRPIIFPLSNPTKLAEATALDLIEWTNGRALVATGIPADPVTYQGVTYTIGQANNALVYPGLGLGTIASTATVLNDEMISQAAHSLGGLVDSSQPGAAVLPPVSQLTHFSDIVAIAVGQSAIDQGLSKSRVTNMKQAIADLKWIPEYQPMNY